MSAGVGGGVRHEQILIGRTEQADADEQFFLGLELVLGELRNPSESRTSMKRPEGSSTPDGLAGDDRSFGPGTEGVGPFDVAGPDVAERHDLFRIESPGIGGLPDQRGPTEGRHALFERPDGAFAQQLAVKRPQDQGLAAVGRGDEEQLFIAEHVAADGTFLRVQKSCPSTDRHSSNRLNR